MAPESGRRVIVSFTSDNDYLVALGKDRDYSFSFSLNGTVNEPYGGHALHKPISAFTTLFQDLQWSHKTTDYSMGVYGFTPGKKSRTIAMKDDRPYASLSYLYMGGLFLAGDGKTAVKSTLTLGALGLSFAKKAQNTAHKYAGYKVSKGWHNQVSQGGEFTAKYTVEVQSYFDIGTPYLQIMYACGASFGYITELNFSAYIRLGKRLSAWWKYQPSGKYFGERSSSFHTRPQSYFSLGVISRARGYNSFLQGQFKHSEVVMKSDQLNRFLIGAWVGYTLSFTQGFSVSYQMNIHASEVKSGQADSPIRWGGLTLAQAF